MSEPILPRYLADFDFRMSHRVKLGYSDDMRADACVKGITGNVSPIDGLTQPKWWREE